MRFFLPVLLLACVCSARAQNARSGNDPALADKKPSRTLISTPESFFESHPPVPDQTVRVSKIPAMIWQDQREIWTSPLRIKKNDLKWLLPAAAVTGLLLATDHHTMTLIHSDAAVRSRNVNISNFGLAPSPPVRSSHSAWEPSHTTSMRERPGYSRGSNGRFFFGLGSVKAGNSARTAGN